MKSEQELNKLSKYLFFLYKNNKLVTENIVVDSNGYIKTSDLCKKFFICEDDLDYIVENNERKFCFDETGTKFKFKKK
jgi:RNA:NAD 2'-phosphotransferase (TPT1/KptA family)